MLASERSELDWLTSFLLAAWPRMSLTSLSTSKNEFGSCCLPEHRVQGSSVSVTIVPELQRVLGTC